MFMCLLDIVKKGIVCLVVVNVTLVITLKMFPWVTNSVIFVNMVRWPPFIDFNRPQDLGLNHTRNFQLQNDDVNLGLWHTLPQELAQHLASNDSTYDYVASLDSGHPIVIYYHGNTGSRAGRHRVELYKLLSQINCHVIVMDYRGYGDSSGSPTEQGVTSDARCVFDWVEAHTSRSPIFLWGHSLGTAITVNMAKQLIEEGKSPSGIMLEAPFTNIKEAAVRHPFILPFRFNPWISSLLLDALNESSIRFETDKNIVSLKAPLLILHARDDFIVPFELGQKLYETALKHRSETGESLTTFAEFEDHHNYGHKHIYRSPDLRNIIKDFVRGSLDWWTECTI